MRVRGVQTTQSREWIRSVPTSEMIHTCSPIATQLARIRRTCIPILAEINRTDYKHISTLMQHPMQSPLPHIFGWYFPHLSATKDLAHVASQRFVHDRRRVGEAAERMMQFTVLMEWMPLLTASQCARVVLCFNPLKEEASMEEFVIYAKKVVGRERCGGVPIRYGRWGMACCDKVSRDASWYDLVRPLW